LDRTFDRVLLARHFALVLGAIVAYFFRSELRIGYVAIWIVGVSASLNFLAYNFRTRPGMARVCEIASPIIGVGGWGALIAVTNGIASPFIAGLWLEVVLSAMSLNLSGIVLVTVGSVGVLWAQQLWLAVGGRSQWLAMVLQSGFLIGMGIATYLVTRRWVRRQEAQDQERAALGHRLDALNRQLEDERVVATLGGNVARLAHGLKNTVHSLRGFVGLIEPKLDEKGKDANALRGLRAAIDDLESLAYLTLGSDTRTGSESPVEGDALASRAGPRAQPSPSGSAVDGVLAGVERAVAQIEVSHPGVVWETKSDGASPVLTIPETSLVEMMLILLRNAVDAMQGNGRGEVATWQEGGLFHLAVTDEGGGFEGADPEALFKAGFTTKADGSGYGLFLARRIVEEHGGAIHARERSGAGVCVEFHLPVPGTEGAP